MKASILRKHLAAVSLFSGKQDIRYYLNGVFVEIAPTETRVAATDGNAAAVCRLDADNAERFEVIVPAATVALALTMKSEVFGLEHDDNGYWSLAGIRFTPVEGTFPDYRRIIPRGHTGKAAQFNPEYIARFAKAGKALGIKSSPIIRHRGVNDAALVHFYTYDEFIGVITPLKSFTEKFPDLGMPAWGPDRV